MENQKITIEQLAGKLGKQVWTKGDLKRIYLNDAGYNTKKMSTKTFIFQNEDGEFKVSCRIECPSQSYQWIQSQEEEVKEGIYNDIEKALATEAYLVINENNEYLDDCGNIVKLNEIYSDYYFSQPKADKIVKEYGFVKNGVVDLKIIIMPVAEFETEVERLNEIERAEYEAKRQAEQNTSAAPVVNTIPAEKPALKNTKTPQFGIGTRVTNPRFGHGTVTAEADDTIEIKFDTDGPKRLLKKFAKIELI